MKSYKIIIATRFQQELNEILDFIALQSLDEARKFKNGLYAKIATLALMPRRCRRNLVANDENVRDLIYKGYVVVFGVDDDKACVEVLGIYKANVWGFE